MPRLPKIELLCLHLLFSFAASTYLHSYDSAKACAVVDEHDQGQDSRRTSPAAYDEQYEERESQRDQPPGEKKCIDSEGFVCAKGSKVESHLCLPTSTSTTKKALKLFFRHLTA